MRAGPLVLDRAAIAAACERYGVRRLVVFGSAVTDRFDESSSDVDFLVEFRDGVADRFDAYFGLKESLESSSATRWIWSPAPPWRTRTSRHPSMRPGRSSMQPESPGMLWDARRAAGLINDFVANRT